MEAKASPKMRLGMMALQLQKPGQEVDGCPPGLLATAVPAWPEETTKRPSTYSSTCGKGFRSKAGPKCGSSTSPILTREKGQHEKELQETVLIVRTSAAAPVTAVRAAK